MDSTNEKEMIGSILDGKYLINSLESEEDE